MFLVRIQTILLFILLMVCSALGQTTGGFIQGQTLTAAQLNAAFSRKMDWAPATFLTQQNVWLAAQTISLNALSASPGTLPVGTLLHLIGANDAVSRITIDSFGANTTALTLRRAKGTAASPTAVQTGDILGALLGAGYGATDYSAQRSSIFFYAGENWTDSAQGSFLDFQTTPIGGIATATQMRLNPSGGLSLGAALLGTDPGPGRLAIQPAASTTAYPSLYVVSPTDCSTGHICSASYHISGGLSGISNTQIFWNDWAIVNDNVVLTVPGSALVTHYVVDVLNGPNATGYRTIIFGDFEQTVASANGANQGNYVGITGVSQTQSGDGGSGSNYYGGYYGGNFWCGNTVASGNLQICTGTEFDNYGLASATQNYKFGINIADGNGSTAARWDSAIAVYRLGAAGLFPVGRGWQCVLCVGDTANSGLQPTSATADVIGIHLENPTVNTGGTGYGATATGTLTWNGGNCSTNPVLNVTTSAGGVVTTINSVTTPGVCTVIPPLTASWTAGGGLSAGSGVIINGGLAMAPGKVNVGNGINWANMACATNFANFGALYKVDCAGHPNIAKATATGAAPGAGFLKMEVTAGTNAGTCKIIAYAGTSTTPTTVIDNVGAGC